MKTFLKIVAVLLLSLLLLGGAAFLWASTSANRTLARTIDTHTVDFPVPFPIPGEEVEELGLTDEEAEALALEQARERGRHLVEARYA